MSTKSAAPAWMARVLLLAAAFDVAGGAILWQAPASLMGWAGTNVPLYRTLWQCLGLIVALCGLGFALAARNPFQLWPMILVGLLGKILVPAGFVWAAASGTAPWSFGILVFALGPLWWLPMGRILLLAARAHLRDRTPPALPLDMALSLYADGEGTDMLEASKRQPQFLVFLRHFGCSFCREALADLATVNERLQETGARLVLVHMSPENEARRLFDKHGLKDVTGISDPDRLLYRAFALRRGSPTQLLGWSIWKRGWDAGVKQGHGLGWLRGDGAQMPGAFVVSQGQVVAQFIHETAADRPDYVVLAAEGADQAEFQDDLEQNGVGVGFQDRLRKALAAEAANQA